MAYNSGRVRRASGSARVGFAIFILLKKVWVGFGAGHLDALRVVYRSPAVASGSQKDHAEVGNIF